MTSPSAQPPAGYEPSVPTTGRNAESESPRPGLRRLGALLVDRRWLLLSVWAVLCSAAHAASLGYGWHYFVTGSHVLASAQGLHLYATHDQLQIGPLTFVVTLPLVSFLPAKVAEAVAIALMTAAGVVLMRLIERTAGLPTTARSNARILIGGLILLPVWAEVAAHWAHPDDVLALLCLFAGLYLLRRGERTSSLVAAALLGLAVDFKPWALLFVPLLLVAPRRDRLACAATYVVVVLVAWLPFLIASPTSLDAGRFQIPVSTASVLHLFGVRGGTPSWCRAAQLVAGAAAVAIAVRRNRWYAAIFVGICMRMLLDPATKNYYESGLLAAGILYDLVAGVTLLPLVSIAAAVLVWIPSYALTALPTERAVLRLLFLLGAPCAILGFSSGRLTRPARSRRAT